MKILALDGATRCGWAHSCGASGTWDLRVRRDESGGMRLVRLRSKLNEMQKLGIDLLVFEASRNLKHGAAVRVAAEIQGVIKLWCEDAGIDYRGYSPSEIKRHATGKGNASKDAVLAASRERFGWVADDNEADALWLMDLARSEYGEKQCKQ